MSDFDAEMKQDWLDVAAEALREMSRFPRHRDVFAEILQRCLDRAAAYVALERSGLSR